MSVLIETSVGDIVIDLLVDQCPRSCTNFLKLCKAKAYNWSLFHTVQKDFIAQAGDPTGTGKGGQSVWGLIHGESRRHFVPELLPKLKHKKRGTVSFACVTPPAADGSTPQPVPLAASQFFITLAPQVPDLDGRHAPFGVVAEGLDVLDKFNDALVDDNGRPYQDIRIRHTVIIDDPFPDPDGLRIPEGSPEPTEKMLKSTRLADIDLLQPTLPPEEEERAHRREEANARALTLEMLGDLPFAEIKPPENVLFVCKLNPVTRDEDLELIFSRFGTIRSCEIIRDKKTGDSLQYAFIEFDEKDACERAFFKMENVLIDDRRIHVDFSQSVGKLHKEWMFARQQKLRGGSELQKKTQYRDDDPAAEAQYDMVFEGQDGQEQERVAGRSGGGSGREKSQPQSHRDARERDSGKGRERPERERDRAQDDGRSGYSRKEKYRGGRGDGNDGRRRRSRSRSGDRGAYKRRRSRSR
ncbi:cyclophilin-like protein [Gonapodya prolifera JEL478]|uniref:Peptidyl-prolyl cis-trans isomerase n=1 Tax=Gonapodya prolifera (strain JEL478) TaxID=1344416 RepID=A0A139AAF6_GONPJ|nr:cyclophilin-like protein [Gonapodya prolifera JEL478]|eukprot:KXS13717.1 cyclophilin-like protein [Gonapodya prolifera JEL478]